MDSLRTSGAAVADAECGSGAGSLGRSAWAFLVIACGLSWAVQLAIVAGGGLDGPLFGTLAPLVMFTPALAAVAAVRMEGRPLRSLVRSRLRPLPFVLAVLVPAASAIGAAFLVTGWLGGSPAPWTHGPAGFTVPSDHGPFLWSGVQGAPALIGNLLLTAAVFSTLGGLLAVGEEVGWRGYLQGRLTRRFGLLRGLTLLGLIWGFWHLPLALIGYTFPEAPVLGALLLYPALGIGLSYFLGWLRESTAGVWAPVLAHGAYNAWFSTLVFEMDFGSEALSVYAILVGVALFAGLASIPALRRLLG